MFAPEENEKQKKCIDYNAPFNVYFIYSYIIYVRAPARVFVY